MQTVYQLERHTERFVWAYRHGKRYAKTNATMVKIRSVWRASSGDWVEITRREIKLFAARGMKNPNVKRKRNPNRRQLTNGTRDEYTP